MNNLIFNNTASELKTEIYGSNTTGDSQILAVADSGELKTLLYAVDDASVITPLEVDDTGSLRVNLTSSSNLTVESNFYDTVSVTDAVVGLTSVTVLADSEISKYKVASMFLYNVGTGNITVALNLSPTTTQTYYIPDDKYGSILLAEGTSTIIELPTHAHYAELVCIGSDAAGALTAYVNAQS
ncbi:DUF6385 domain-containing protein [Anaeromicropila populeti]|uniref:DUF6385 domain-containing protein n=1 Tax=Anaeromicropila populeti TaxID=37658 RepID=A0A1I6HXW7_9FIRM|nr:DUF6385 domain-containing protein [Anaeromicropila populeti]SFR59249.1 hypothetical protein SAMN05661086_00385 [Anaeromicropila populeti]